MLEAITGGYKTKANVNGTTLVLSTPDAVSPGVWRLDLAETKECVFEVDAAKKKDHFDLVKKNASGTKKIIATYDARPKAMRALIKVTKALETVETASNQSVYVQKKKGFPWLKLLLLIVFGYIAFSIFTVSRPLLVGAPQAPQVQAPQAQSNAPQATDGQQERPVQDDVGVPMSADDFLN